MSFRENFKRALFSMKPDEFDRRALDLYAYQYENNPVYRRYADYLSKSPANVSSVDRIPFLPIQFFKNHEVTSLPGKTPEKIFYSSGTTGMERSRHLVYDLKWYEEVSMRLFEQFYGKISDYNVLALLPSYMENPASSLLHMVEYFIRESKDPNSGFRSDTEQLMKELHAFSGNKKRLVLGVTYALLDLASVNKNPFDSLITVMETGGMKGRRREMLRKEVHEILQESFKLSSIHSEYGMTELMSQAYSEEKGKFKTPVWMKVFIREVNDPFIIGEKGQGAINVIDLANVDSCAFIETADMGVGHSDGTFEVIGRMDNSDVRGCNLLYLA